MRLPTGVAGAGWGAVALWAALGPGTMAGCATEAEEKRRVESPSASGSRRRHQADPGSEGEGEARETSGTTGDPGSVPPEKFDEIQQFFYSKMGALQYKCYDGEVEKTHEKYQGNISVSLIVRPGGKASDVKITESTIKSKGIEACVVSEVQTWSWPDVPAPAPYNGSVNFKPAW